MRIAVTGGFGFLGSRLAATLLDRGGLRGTPLRTLVLADRSSAATTSRPPMLAAARTQAAGGGRPGHGPALPGRRGDRRVLAGQVRRRPAGELGLRTRTPPR